MGAGAVRRVAEPVRNLFSVESLGNRSTGKPLADPPPHVVSQQKEDMRPSLGWNGRNSEPTGGSDAFGGPGFASRGFGGAARGGGLTPRC